MRDRDAAKRKVWLRMTHAPEQSTKSCEIQETITSRLLKHLIILMLLVNLKVILEKHGKPLRNLLPVAPTIQR